MCAVIALQVVSVKVIDSKRTILPPFTVGLSVRLLELPFYDFAIFSFSKHFRHLFLQIRPQLENCLLSSTLHVRDSLKRFRYIQDSVTSVLHNPATESLNFLSTISRYVFIAHNSTFNSFPLAMHINISYTSMTLQKHEDPRPARDWLRARIFHRWREESSLSGYPTNSHGGQLRTGKSKKKIKYSRMMIQNLLRLTGNR